MQLPLICHPSSASSSAPATSVPDILAGDAPHSPSLSPTESRRAASWPGPTGIELAPPPQLAAAVARPKHRAGPRPFPCRAASASTRPAPPSAGTTGADDGLTAASCRDGRPSRPTTAALLQQVCSCVLAASRCRPASDRLIHGYGSSNAGRARRGYGLGTDRNTDHRRQGERSPSLCVLTLGRRLGPGS